MLWHGQAADVFRTDYFPGLGWMLRRQLWQELKHSTAQHSTAQHSTAQHSTAQHSMAWHGMA
jgi:hypothetical protein